jgi:PTH1 family peptidyl-tRNA hydrolase
LADVLAEQWRLGRFRRRGNALVAEAQRARQRFVLVKPQTYMNRSGEALSPFLAASGFEPFSDLLVVVDDLALPLGSFRLRARGGSGGHNGLSSIEDAVGSEEYARLRIGIGPLPEDADDQADWVLEPFGKAELTAFADVLPPLVEAVECWLVDGIDVAMNRHNQRGTTE